MAESRRVIHEALLEFNAFQPGDTYLTECDNRVCEIITRKEYPSSAIHNSVAEFLRDIGIPFDLSEELSRFTDPADLKRMFCLAFCRDPDEYEARRSYLKPRCYYLSQNEILWLSLTKGWTVTRSFALRLNNKRDPDFSEVDLSQEKPSDTSSDKPHLSTIRRSVAARKRLPATGLEIFQSKAQLEQDVFAELALDRIGAPNDNARDAGARIVAWQVQFKLAEGLVPVVRPGAGQSLMDGLLMLDWSGLSKEKREALLGPEALFAWKQEHDPHLRQLEME